MSSRQKKYRQLYFAFKIDHIDEFSACNREVLDVPERKARPPLRECIDCKTSMITDYVPLRGLLFD